MIELKLLIDNTSLLSWTCYKNSILYFVLQSAMNFVLNLVIFYYRLCSTSRAKFPCTRIYCLNSHVCWGTFESVLKNCTEMYHKCILHVIVNVLFGCWNCVQLCVLQFKKNRSSENDFSKWMLCNFVQQSRDKMHFHNDWSTARLVNVVLFLWKISESQHVKYNYTLTFCG